MEANNWEEIEGPTKGLIVSGDGTWRKRRFNSLHGVSAITGYYSGKIDILILAGIALHTARIRTKRASTHHWLKHRRRRAKEELLADNDNPLPTKLQLLLRVPHMTLELTIKGKV
ncbi:hypothetical protein EAI_10689 [Harpegnathos saltator]|uniref:Uncharacterized protein n=1 Tax=Harpegnathos saltator TaxID=610380 RepID=E2BW88_HARSA|nr:hypothetical protein EAI_10689 [Harpegnathos saltator]